MMNWTILAALATLLLCRSLAAAACTTIIVSKGASADGGVMVCHSDDNDLSDQSIVHVPARDWPEGAMRPIYASAVANADLPLYNAFTIPRIADAGRAPGYANPEYPRSIPVGFIPQAAHTYAYLDGNYAIMNEHGLMFGECTNGAFWSGDPVPGNRILYSSELARIALERCRTAREAIRLMGGLIERYGFYGTGETLPVADADEAWVMEMAPSPDGEKGGLWVAQRVPDGEFFVAANEFRIRDLDPANPDQMIGENVFAIIDKAGTRSPKDASKPMDWLTSVSHGEYSHPYYSLRRVWRAMSLVAPSRNFPAWVEDGTTRAYPFSVKPDRKLTLDDVKNIYRDHYEGTEFDLTKGAAAGPFGNPNRYLGPKDPSGDVGDPTVKLAGAWERPIGMFYTGYATICHLRPDAPAPLRAVCWLALNTPGESAFVPLAVGPLPASYERGFPSAYDADSAWWNYNLVGEYANLKYSYMIQDIRARAAMHEKRSEELLAELRTSLAAAAAADPERARGEFAAGLAANAERIRSDWRKLFGDLAVKYNQGFVNSPGKMAVKVGYPDAWLDATDYRSGPTAYKKPSTASREE